MRGVRALRVSRFEDPGGPGLWSVDGVVWPAAGPMPGGAFRAPGWRSRRECNRSDNPCWPERTEADIGRIARELVVSARRIQRRVGRFHGLAERLRANRDGRRNHAGLFIARTAEAALSTAGQWFPEPEVVSTLDGGSWGFPPPGFRRSDRPRSGVYEGLRVGRHETGCRVRLR